MNNDNNLEELSKRIHQLKKHHHIEILRMIKEHSQAISISENTNGCFINMNDFDEELIYKIKTYVDYNENQEIELNKHENMKNNIIQEMIK
tara:strand:+ start:64 stop:336 length:273 start_codon:yes stop_codon:yes gene_type:complete